MRSRFFATIVCAVLFLGFSAPSNAAVVDVSKLYVDSISATFNTSVTFPVTNTTIFSPPGVWVMGEYHGVIANDSVSGINYTVESTGAYGAPPSSGTVDTTLGTIDLVLSDLHMTISGLFSGETDLWNSSTSSIDANSYDPATGAFVYGWSDSASVQYSVLTIPVDYSIEIAGTASPVPLPAAVWLFGSGLAGLIGLKKKFMK